MGAALLTASMALAAETVTSAKPIIMLRISDQRNAGSPSHANNPLWETPALTSLTPPVLKPSGEEFKFWRDETVYTKTYYTDTRSAAASDSNPGTSELPFKTINQAAEVLQPGERVVVRAGIYRECIRPARGGTAPSRMIGYFADGEVVVKGSEPAGNKWSQSDAEGIYSLDLGVIPFGDYNPFKVDCLSEQNLARMKWAKSMQGKPVITEPCGMVFQEGRRLFRAATREEMVKTEGSHWTDRDADKLWVHVFGKKHPNDLLMEITTRRGCFRPEVRGLGFIHLAGFVFEQVGNCFPAPQEGAVSACAGNHLLIEKNTVREINGIGIDIGSGWYEGKIAPPEPGEGKPEWTIVRGNRISETGIAGISGLNSDNMLIEDNVLRNNTLYPAEGIQECAGIKTHRNHGTLIRRNLICEESAHGIWMDSNNFDSRCTQNVIVKARRGIFIEASHDAPFSLIDRNLAWDCAQGLYEHDCRRQLFVQNFVGASKVGIMLRGKITDRMTGGGGDTVANNAFFQCKQDIEVSTNIGAMIETNVIYGNFSDTNGLAASLDSVGLKLTLRACAPLPRTLEKTARVTHDFLDRPWPADGHCAGIVPLPGGTDVELRLAR